MPQHLRFKTIWFIYFFLSISLHTIDLLLVRRGMMLSSAESYNMCRLKENVTTTVKAFGEPIPMPRWHRQRGLTLHSYWGERRNPDLRPLFLVARSDSRRTDFNERALELRNCRKRRLVGRESSGVSRPFSSLRDRQGFPSSSKRFARSLAYSPFASPGSEMHEVWKGEYIERVN